MSDQREAIHVTPGAGIVARLTHAVGCAFGHAEDLAPVLARLDALDDAPWTEIVRTLTADIVDVGFDAHPSIAMAALTEDGVAALVFGDTQLVATIDGRDTILDGRDSTTWVDVLLHGEISQIMAGGSTDDGVVGILRAGVVGGGGFLLDASVAAPVASVSEEVVPIAPADTIAEVESTIDERPVDLLADADPVSDTDLAADPTDEPSLASGLFGRIQERTVDEETSLPADVPQFAPAEAPQPPADPAGDPHATATTVLPTTQLRGVRCPDGHLTSVDDQVCRTCGQMPAEDAEVTVDVRPVLGVITFDDGAVLPLNRPALIGSSTPQTAEIAGEPATTVRLDDGAGGIDELHLQVHLVGWNVELVDLDSASGTFVSLPGERPAKTKLRANQPVTLASGTTVSVGARTFTFTIGPSPLPS